MQNNPNQNPNQNQQQVRSAQQPNQQGQNPNQAQARPNQPNQPNQPNRTADQTELTPEEQRRATQQTERSESGMPGGGVGRKDVPGRTGVYPVSADEGASGSAKVQGEQGFGQGERGAAGYQDSGGSAIIPPDELGKTDKEVI